MNSKTQPFVSIVTPVYNGDKYLSECIESVLAQTYQNWEYIIVNNCSTDRTHEIAKSYELKDSRIRVHNNAKFLGATQNFNHAFEQISKESKYCKVVHADDWLFPECIEQMVCLAEDNPTVSIVGSYVLKGDKVECDGLPYPSPVVNGRELCRMSLRRELYVFGSPSSLLIRSEIVRSRTPFYNEDYYHEDMAVCFDILMNSDFGFVHQVLSFTRLHEESITESVANRLNSNRLENLGLVVNYGPMVFEEREYRSLYKKYIKSYYRFLVRNVGKWNDKNYLAYHREGFNKMGLTFKTDRLLFALLLEVIEWVFNPKQSISRLIR